MKKNKGLKNVIAKIAGAAAVLAVASAVDANSEVNMGVGASYGIDITNKLSAFVSAGGYATAGPTINTAVGDNLIDAAGIEGGIGINYIVGKNVDIGVEAAATKDVWSGRTHDGVIRANNILTSNSGAYGGVNATFYVGNAAIYGNVGVVHGRTTNKSDTQGITIEGDETVSGEGIAGGVGVNYFLTDKTHVGAYVGGTSRVHSNLNSSFSVGVNTGVKLGGGNRSSVRLNGKINRATTIGE